MPSEPDKASPSGSPAGRRFGPYILQDLLGAGGMGEVYRARDTRLGRDVAVKMLSSGFSSDPERLTRLAREARLLASLNHPHIGAIYELEEVDGVSGLVLEIVEGQTLADLLRDGPIAEARALSIADQIAGALRAAHETGIIHRDLKPGNIKITPDGTVKVLDFGVAKALEVAPAHEVTAATRSAVLDATSAGIVLGTPAYMSPEQARGEPLDERTDIWAFGAVLYEMLTGTRPFSGHTTTETLAAVLKEDPDWSRVPEAAQRLLRACLQKDPAKRLRAIADARLLLDDAPRTASSRRHVRWLWPALAGLAVLLALTTLLMPLRGTDAVAPAVRFHVAAPPGLTPNAPIVSPDGRSIAFVATAPDGSVLPGVWIHSLETGTSRRLFQPEKGMFPLPFWSPDGRWLGVIADGKLAKIDVATGAQHRLTDVQGLASSGAWNADDVILFTAPAGLMRIAAQGGTPEPVTRVDAARGEIGHFLPAFLPGGRRFLYLRASSTPDATGIYDGSLDAKPEEQRVSRLAVTRSGPIYWPATRSGQAFLLFFRDSNLLAQGFDPATLTVAGQAIPVAERVEVFGVPGARYGHASVSGNGVFAFRQREVVHARLVWVDRRGNETGALVRQPLENPSNLRFSPDGRRLALTVDGNIWVYNLDGRPPVKLTAEGVADVLLWSRDGNRLIYEDTGVPPKLLSIAADSPGDLPVAIFTPGHYHPQGWSAAGDRMIASVNTPNSATGWDIVSIPVGVTGEPSPLLQTQFVEGLGGVSVSPDGAWLAYTSTSTGSAEVWVRPYPGPGKAARISPNGGADPVWSKNGQELFFISEGRMMAVRTTRAGGALDFTAPVPLFESPYLHRSNTALAYDVTSDGRFLMMKREGTRTDSSPIHVVLNWRPGQTR